MERLKWGLTTGRFQNLAGGKSLLEAIECTREKGYAEKRCLGTKRIHQLFLLGGAEGGTERLKKAVPDSVLRSATT